MYTIDMETQKENEANCNQNRKYAFRLRPEDEDLPLSEMRHRDLVAGLKETTSAHGLSHISQANGEYRQHCKIHFQVLMKDWERIYLLGASYLLQFNNVHICDAILLLCVVTI